jgi:hypothetical protein
MFSTLVTCLNRCLFHVTGRNIQRYWVHSFYYIILRGRRGHDRMVVRFTTTYAICLSPLMLWVRISIRARCTTLCDKVCQWLATVLWFSPGPPVSSTNKIDRHNITEILLKVALNIYIILFRKYCLYMVYWFSGQKYFHNKIFSYVFHIKLLIFKTFSPYQIFLKFSPLKVTLIKVIFF